MSVGGVVAPTRPPARVLEKGGTPFNTRQGTEVPCTLLHRRVWRHLFAKLGYPLEPPPLRLYSGQATGLSSLTSPLHPPAQPCPGRGFAAADVVAPTRPPTACLELRRGSAHFDYAQCRLSRSPAKGALPPYRSPGVFMRVSESGRQVSCPRVLPTTGRMLQWLRRSNGCMTSPLSAAATPAARPR